MNGVTSMLADNGIPATWLFLRTTGVIALALLTVSVVAGILGPAIRRPGVRLTSVSIHGTAAVTGLMLLVGHVLLAVADSYVDVPWLAIVVPGGSVWQPLWVGLGAVAFDLLVVVTVTTATRLRAPSTWRRAHLLAYPAWALAWGHAVTTGTDAWSRPMLALAAASAGAVCTAAIARVVRPGVDRRSRGLTGPATAEPPSLVDAGGGR